MAATMFANGVSPTALKAPLEPGSAVTTLDSLPIGLKAKQERGFPITCTTLDSLPSMDSILDESEATPQQRKCIEEVSRSFAEMEMRLQAVCLQSMEVAAQVRADRETNARLEAQNADLQALLGQLLAGQKPTLSQEQQSLIFGPRAPPAPEPPELPLPRFAAPSDDAELILEQALRDYDARVASMSVQKQEGFPEFRL